MQTTPTLTDLSQQADAFLLSFDGPVANLFVDYSEQQITLGLRRCLEHRGVMLPATFDDDGDSLELLRWVGEQRPDLVREVDQLLSGAECLAAETARPTAGAADVIRAAPFVAIVSDKSHAAIHEYLQRCGLLDDVAVVIGRPFADPARMKPSPEGVHRALAALGMAAHRCMLVGDSAADIQTARAAGICPIGYATTPDRKATLRAAGAKNFVHHMSQLATALQVAA